MELVIVLIALIILVPLANYVLERMRRRYQSPLDSRRVPDMGVRRQAAPSAPKSSAGREREQVAPPASAIQPSRRPGIPQTLFRTKRDVRRTIVAMTILGPCRAYDPPG
ncbi:MAG TPA: hypothetical protein VGB27_03505 [Candidatus Binatia bacterium]